jgi:hypothetical protein
VTTSSVDITDQMNIRLKVAHPLLLALELIRQHTSDSLHVNHRVQTIFSNYDIILSNIVGAFVLEEFVSWTSLTKLRRA